MIKTHLHRPDFFLLASVGIITILGVLILSSASASFSLAKYDDSYYLLWHQIVFGIIPGLILGFIAYKTPIEVIRKLAPLLILATLVLLVMVFSPNFGISAKGAQRWIYLGFTSIQPSEILKLTFILYLASWLTSHTEKSGARVKTKKKEFSNTFFAFLAVIVVIGILLVLQPDISTFGIIAVTACCMYFLSDTPFRHTMLIVSLGAAVLFALVCFQPHALDRFMAWWSPTSDPMGKSFQPNQALIMVGSGGLFGQGFGSSSSKYSLLPELVGDSIFASYAQETGFIGTAILIVLFAFFVWRSYRVAMQNDDKFSRLTVMGITIWITVQSFINMASTTRLIPLSGVPLPFMSYGGTAMMAEIAAIGIILNISRHRR